MILSLADLWGTREPPIPPHRKLWQSCMLVPFPRGVGSAPFGKSWICHFCKFSHDPFIGGSMGCKRAPPSHPTGNFGKVVCWHPFIRGVGSAPSRKSWIHHFCKFSHDPFIGGSMGRKRAPHPTPQETLAKLYVGALSPGSWLRPIWEIMDLPLLQISANYKRLNGKMFVMCTLWIWCFMCKKYVYSVYIRTLTKCVLIVSIFILQL